MSSEDDSMTDTFAIGDLVWAKMKYHHPWPGVIVDPKNSKPKKGENIKLIYFFGSKNYGWIDTQNMKRYVPQILDVSKCTQLFKDACVEIEDVYKNGKNSKFNPQNTGDNLFNKLVKTPKNNPEPSTSKGITSKKKSVAVKNQSGVGSKNSGKKRGKNPKKGKVSKESDSSDSEEKIVKSKKRFSTSAVSETKRLRTQRSNADTTSEWINDDAPTPKRSLLVNPLLDRPSLCPEPNKVSQTFLDFSNIVPSHFQFGFIGLGNMGSCIAENLLNSGHRVVIWNRTSEKTKDFIKAGAIVVQTSQDVVQMSDITFSCVSDIQAVKELMFGNNSALDVITENKAYVEMSTIDIETSKLLYDAVTSRGGRYLEAQIQGSRLEAKEGNLLILSAGDRSLYDNCLSCFEAIGRCSFFLGDVGNAAKMNLVIQLMSGSFLASCAESLALGDKLGLHLTDVLEVFSLTKLSNPFIEEKGKNIINSSFETDHALRLMQKDMDLAINMSQTVNQPIPLAAVTSELYKRANRLGYKDHDSSAVFVATRF